MENKANELIAKLMDIVQEIVSCGEIEHADPLAPDTAAAITKSDEILLEAAEYLDNSRKQ